ncbi:MAG: ABC transporter ATP-binding protein [Alphaproteobacteria bacterium]|nr:ABC transporter ATP-binding protein [Alphaproteobacteria bacterium]
MSLETRSLTVRYKRASAIAGASAALPEGVVTALIGPNGAGKSTLFRAMAGLQSSEGTVLIGGAPADPATRRATVAYMPQDTSASSSLTLIEVVLLGRLHSLGLSIPRRMLTQADAALARFGLAPLAGRTLDAVSGGQRQLVYLAQALFRRSRILLLDEPTASLDLRHQLIVLDMVRRMAREDAMVIGLAMHDLALAARFADNVICLADGRIEAAGTAQTVLTADRVQRLYGVEVEVTIGGDGRPKITPLCAI